VGKTWWRLPKSEHLIPTVKAFYAPEEAELLTDMPPEEGRFGEV
jgi:hypothetical protein